MATINQRHGYYMQQSEKHTGNLKRGGSPGRKPGIGNKTTESIKRSIAKAVEANGHKLGHWFNRIEEEQGAEAAINAYCKLAEYALPKQRYVETVTAHIDLAAILDRARSRLIDVTPAQQAIGQDGHNGSYVKQQEAALVAFEQQQAERVQAELDAPFNPLELDGASEEDTAP